MFKLNTGDTIGFVSPSSTVVSQDPTRNRIEAFERGRSFLHASGFHTRLSPHCLSQDVYGVSGASPEARAADIMQMFRDPTISAIWCTQGGDTANEILPYLDFSVVRDNPKLFIGYSDNSVLLNSILKHTGMVTYYGPSPYCGIENFHLEDAYTREEFFRLLVRGESGPVIKRSQWKAIQPGRATGRLVGGNFQCFLKLFGTPHLPEVEGSILLLEGMTMTVEVALTRIAQYRAAGVFDKIAGLVVGDVTSFDRGDVFSPSGVKVTLEELIRDRCGRADLPILKIYEFGHQCPSTFLPIGGKASMDVENLSFELLP